MMEFILSHVEKGVMTLTLNRPERLNSFNDEMHAQLAECLKQVERDDTIRCLLLTGAGRGFCAGQDLNDRNVDPTGPAPDLGMSVERFYNPLVRRLAKLPKPVICAVNGVAAGAGATSSASTLDTHVKAAKDKREAHSSKPLPYLAAEAARHCSDGSQSRGCLGLVGGKCR